MKNLKTKAFLLVCLLFGLYTNAQIEKAPARTEGEGPWSQLIIRGVTVIDGTLSPPIGPIDIVVENNRIASVQVVGFPGMDINPDRRPKLKPGGKELNAEGMYLLPGFVDTHAHIGGSTQGTPAEYVFKLWLAHGITTVREVGSGMGLDWTVDHRNRSEAGEITAPRIIVHAMFPGSSVTSAIEASAWVREVHRRGAEGVKLRGATPAATRAIYQTTAELGMGTSNHHDQTSVYSINVLDSARMGLDSMEHWYGLPESLFTDRTIQDYPADYNYSDEQWRFGQAGRLWQQAAAPGSDKWNTVRDELVDLDFTLSPTFTIYEANRDVMRARDAEWHSTYTLPTLQEFFMPDPKLHGYYHFDWTTADEVAWRKNSRHWRNFVTDYKLSLLSI